MAVHDDHRLRIFNYWRKGDESARYAGEGVSAYSGRGEFEDSTFGFGYAGIIDLGSNNNHKLFVKADIGLHVDAQADTPEWDWEMNVPLFRVSLELKLYDGTDATKKKGSVFLSYLTDSYGTGNIEREIERVFLGAQLDF
jgi:hypothetical protein